MNVRSAFSWIRLASAAAWLGLGGIVSLSGMIYPGGLFLNLAMGLAFGALGMVILTRRVSPFSRSGVASGAGAIFRIETVLVAISLIAGSIFIFAAGYRFFVEKMAVFG